MAIGVTTTVPGSIEMYDSLHAAMLNHPIPPDVGLISHASRRTTDGFQVIEVWESKEAFERFMRDDFPKYAAAVPGDAGPAPEVDTEFWEVRGLVVPGAGLFS